MWCRRGEAEAAGKRFVEAALREPDDWMKSGAAQSFLRGLEAAGWDLTRISLPTGPWRVANGLLLRSR